MTDPTRWWKGHLVRKTEGLRTTWTFKLVVLLCSVIAISSTRAFWIPAVGRSLVCSQTLNRRDAIVLDDFDDSYLLFARAAALQSSGMAARVFVHARVSAGAPEPNVISKRIVEVTAEVARLRDPAVVPVVEVEPIALNVAYQIREALAASNIRSVILVTPAFRSRRSFSVYAAVLRPAGISVDCVPVFGALSPETWTRSWHGIQEVSEQVAKLQYYRFYVLPFLLQTDRPVIRSPSRPREVPTTGGIAAPP